jgi:hypothetical protein
LILTAEKFVIVNQGTLLLLRGNGRYSLDGIGDTTFFLGVFIGKNNLGLNLFGLAWEDDLAIVLGILTTVLQIFNKDWAIGWSVHFLSLTDVLANGKEGNFFVVGALLRSKIYNLRRKLSLHCLNRIKLMTVIQSDNNEARVACLLAQCDLTDFSWDHSITFFTLRCDESGAGSLFKNFGIIWVDDSESVAGDVGVLGVFIEAVKFIFLAQVKLFHLGDEHLRDLFFLNTIVDVPGRDHFILAHGGILKIDFLGHHLSDRFELRILGDQIALHSHIERDQEGAVGVLLVSKLLNFLNTEVKCVIGTVIVSEPLVEEWNESVKHEILKQGNTHVCATAGLKHTDDLIEVLNDLRGSLWATVGAQGI